MFYNNEIFNSKKNQKITSNAFFSYVAQMTNKNLLKIILTDDRFLENILDMDKVYFIRLNLKFKKKKVYKKKPKCTITGKQKGNIRFFGHISRFQLKNMVCEGKLLIGVSRFGW